MKTESYAHSKEGEPPEHWHRLEDHLRRVAELASSFAEDFNNNLNFWFLKLK